MGLLEYLKKILGDEEGQKAYDKIQADKESVLLVDSKKESKYVEKSKFDNTEQQAKDYKQQLKDRDKQLKDLKEKVKNVKDTKELEGKIEELEKNNRETTEKYEKEIEQMKFDVALEKTLTNANVYNPKTVKALLKLDNVKLDGDNFIGLNEQIEALKESDSYLFKSEKEEGSNNNDDDFFGTGSTVKTPGKKSDKSFGTMLGEQRAKEIASSEDTEDNFFS